MKQSKNKKKRKLKSTAQKQSLQVIHKEEPIHWTPPYPTVPTLPTTNQKLIVNSPMKYQVPPPSVRNMGKTSKTQSQKERVIYPREQEFRREFLETFRSLTYRWRSWDVWTDFITLVAFTISNSVDRLHYDEREETYLRIIKKYTKEEQQLFPKLFAYLVLALEENPEQDFLGDIYTELGLNSKEHRQIFTPYHISHLMAEITLGDFTSQVKEKGFVEIHDCCCGAGAILIAAANVVKDKLKKVDLNFQNHLLLTGQDIDSLVTMMCYIQLSLLGVAGYFKVGNALTDPMKSTSA